MSDSMSIQVTPACDAKIRPFRPVNEYEYQCDLGDAPHERHHATIRDYAYPGSATELGWRDSDRRTFRGDWRPCLRFPGCILPSRHRGGHAT